MVSRLSYINTDAALEEANAFANRILHPRVAGRDSPIIRHEHTHWGYPGWGYFPQPVYLGPEGRSHSGKRDHSWVAIPATVIALITMYCIGQNHAERSQAKAGMAKLAVTCRSVRAELSQAHPALKSTVQAVFEKEMQILEQIRSAAAMNLLLKGIFVTSVIGAGIGGLATAGWFIPAMEALLGYGSISAFLMGCAMLYRAGFDSKDTWLQLEAEELQVHVHRAAKVLDQIS